MCRNGRQYVFQTDPEFLRFHHELFDLPSQQLRSLGLARFRQGRNYRANAGPALQQAGRDQVGDDLVCGVGIDFEFLAEDSHGGEGIARTHLSGDHCFFCGIHDLLMERKAGPEIHAERNHGPYYYT